MGKVPKGHQMGAEKTKKTTKTPKRSTGEREQKGRPRATQQCTDVASATRFRAQTLREIARDLTRIHDPLLTEYQVRDINDTLNRLLRERRAWEYRIKQLGGPDYTSGTTTTAGGSGDTDTVTVKGYKYFGRARELPDVVQLLQEAETEKKRRRTGQDAAKALQLFLQPKHWPQGEYYFGGQRAEQMAAKLDSGEFVLPKHKENAADAPSLTSLAFFADPPLTQDRTFMEKFLLQQKKKLLLQRLRMQKIDRDAA